MALMICLQMAKTIQMMIKVSAAATILQTMNNSDKTSATN